MGTNTGPATRVLVSAIVGPDQTFQLTPPSLLTQSDGFRPRINLGVPPLTLGGSAASSGFALTPPTFGQGASQATAPSAPPAPAPAPAAPRGDWKVLAQAVQQVNGANWTLWSSKAGTPPPLAADTFQFNLLFSGFKDKFQIGEYFSGSGSFTNDALGRVYSISYGVLLGGNDLLVRGPLSFLNPQFQAGPNFTNLGRPDAAAQIGGNISNFINFNPNNGALTVGVGGQFGYAYDFSSGVSTFSASLLMQFQLQKKVGSP